jgi:multiple sugar transport system substrate-binding protein
VVKNASRRLSALPASVAIASLVAACTPPESDALELWSAGAEGEVVAQLIAGFGALHPDIRVHVQQLPFRGAHEKLLTAAVGGSTPDVAQLGNTWIPEFAMIGALDALDGAVSRSSVVQEADYFAGAWDTNRFEGHLYGIPWYVDTRVLFYRSDLLAEVGFDTPPATWAEWLAMLSALKARFAERGEKDRMPIVLPLFDPAMPLALALQQGEPLLRDGDRYGNFRGAGFRRALEFYVSLFRLGLAPHDLLSQVGNLMDEFARGRVVFFLNGPFQIGEIERRLPREFADRWATAPLPGPDGPSSSLALGSSLVVFARSKRKAAAWQLIEYLSQPEVQRRFYELTGDLPPRRSSWADRALSARPQTGAFRGQLERLEPMPSVPEWERIASEVTVLTERAALGAMSVEAAAIELDASTDRILEKRRWILEHRTHGDASLGTRAAEEAPRK